MFLRSLSSLFILISSTQVGDINNQIKKCNFSKDVIILSDSIMLPQSVRNDIERRIPSSSFQRNSNIEPSKTSRVDVLTYGRSGNNWFVWYSHDEHANHIHVLGYIVTDKERQIAADPWVDFIGNPCVATSAFLSGVHPSRE